MASGKEWLLKMAEKFFQEGVQKAEKSFQLATRRNLPGFSTCLKALIA